MLPPVSISAVSAARARASASTREDMSTADAASSKFGSGRMETRRVTGAAIPRRRRMSVMVLRMALVGMSFARISFHSAMDARFSSLAAVGARVPAPPAALAAAHMAPPATFAAAAGVRATSSSIRDSSDCLSPP